LERFWTTKRTKDTKKGSRRGVLPAKPAKQAGAIEGVMRLRRGLLVSLVRLVVQTFIPTSWEAVNDHLQRPAFAGMSEAPARFGEPQLVRPRLGQGGFRVLVTDTYNRRCAITGERTLPALEAAHIRPYGEGGDHDARNGLLLRRDIHSLFDAGYVTVTPDARFEVSRRIKEEFENGRHYYELHGKPIFAPVDVRLRPDPGALRWHNENAFRG
jgi:putative restriction endonuclease